ncbi:MAG: Gfo/Idh/MocA family oxidoreductase [Roseovarius sp.]|nr:Gfo/Idh/MocA family oxidoreductase [Roseovarius sp.]
MADRGRDVNLPICVIGGGSIGRRHAEQAAKSPAARLTAVVETDLSRGSELSSAGLPVVSDIERVPKDTRAAIIATPTPDHCDSALAAISKGWGLLVEKPLAFTMAEADRIVSAASMADVPLYTGHHRRCHPFVIAARDEICRLGDLVAIQGIWALRKHAGYFEPPWRRERGSGPILTNLSHEIDLLRLFAGDVAMVSAMTMNAARGLPIEDTAAVIFRFASGSMGTFLVSDAGVSPWNFEAASGENPMIPFSGQDSMRFIGTRASLSFPSLERWEGVTSEDVDWRKPLRGIPGAAMPRINPILEQIGRFAQAVDGARDDILSTGSDGRAALAATLAALHSGRTGKAIDPSAIADIGESAKGGSAGGLEH